MFSVMIESEPHYETTPALHREQRSRVVADCHLKTWVGTWLIQQVLYHGKFEPMSPARRRVLEWGLARGFLRPRSGAPAPTSTPDDPTKSVRQLLASAETMLKAPK